MPELGVLMVGMGGAVASTVIAGVELMVEGRVPRRGMVTEAGAPGTADALTNLLEFAPLEQLEFGGWDVRAANIFEAALEHEVLPRHLLDSARPRLSALAPWPALFAPSYSERIHGDHTLKVETFRAEVATIAAQIESFKRARSVERLVMVNLASTESFLEPSAVHQTLGAFESGLDRSDPSITPAMRYVYVANQLGIPHVNFTPSLTHIPALAEQAERTRTPFAGMDGKTGQTLLKTALAAMLRVRRLHIEGWYSTNILGNRDGLALSSPASNKTKVLSKSAVLDSIVGYPVENHQVHIHYYRPRGDSKEAWDNVDIVGFAGVPMQIKINFLCQDSALAAPLVLDLVRLLDVAKRVGESGPQRQLSLFFKSPHELDGLPVVHDLFEQERGLMQWAREASAKLRTGRKRPAAPLGVHVNGGE